MARIESLIAPDFSLEQDLLGKGFVSAGVDEVGRGPLAGPVVAAAAILDPDRIPRGLNDSKKLTRRRRESMLEDILQSAIVVSVASVGAREIDRTDIRKASLEAMRRAVAALSVRPGHVLIDGNALPPGLGMPATSVIKGDARCLSIAAASIIAKVVRDRMMDLACNLYPGYGFSSHAGYGTPSHLKAIQELGPTPIHRMSFRPLRAA